MSRKTGRDSADTRPVVWLLWSGEGSDRAIASAHGSRDAACAALCQAVLDGVPIRLPRIEALVVDDTTPITSTNVDAVAAVIRAYRALNGAGKSDMRRASMGPLRDALDALAYPMMIKDRDVSGDLDAIPSNRIED
jgi:hypothetical protein